MTDPTTTTAKVYPANADVRNYGLHAGVLGPVETLAQSVSAVAPSTSPSLTIPLGVRASPGNATWFVYLLAYGGHLPGGLLREPVRSVSRLRPDRSIFVHGQYAACPSSA